MTKTQTILVLCLFLVIVFSMNMILENPIQETFRNSNGPNRLNDLNGLKLNRENNTTKNKNIVYSESGFKNSNLTSDDQPSFFGFS
jgi:hypothetical protein